MSEQVEGKVFEHRRLGSTLKNRMRLAVFGQRVTFRQWQLFRGLWDDDPTGEDGLRFSQVVGNAIVLEAMAGGDVEAGLDGDGRVILVKGKFQDIIDWIIANWDKILKMILDIIALFTTIFLEAMEGWSGSDEFKANKVGISIELSRLLLAD